MQSYSRCVPYHGIVEELACNEQLRSDASPAFAPFAEDPTTTWMICALAMILGLRHLMHSFQSQQAINKKEISIDGWKVSHHHVLYHSFSPVKTCLKSWPFFSDAISESPYGHTSSGLMGRSLAAWHALSSMASYPPGPAVFDSFEAKLQCSRALEHRLGFPKDEDIHFSKKLGGGGCIMAHFK